MDNIPIILNNFEIFKALEKSNRIGANSLILTENPLVFKILNDRSFKLKSLDAYLTQEEKVAIGTCASRIATAWVSAINEYYADYGIPLGQPLNNSLCYLANAVLYRAVQLKRSIQEFGTIQIPDFLREKRPYFFDQKYLPFSSQDNFFSSLAHYSPFRERTRPCPIDLEGDSLNNHFHRGYEVIRNVQWDYLLQYLLGLSSFRTKLASRILDKMIPQEGKNVRFFGFGKMIILLHQPNDLMRWKLFPLFFNARFLRLEDIGLPHAEITHRPGDRVLIATLEQLFHPRSFDLLAPDEFEGTIGFLAQHCCDFISTYLLPAYAMLEPRIRDLCRQGRFRDPTYFFSGGLTEPVPSLISLIYSSYGIPTVGFQEGGACLLKLYRNLMSHTHISSGDAFVAYHENEETYFKKRTHVTNRPFFISGTRKLLRGPLPKLSSMIGRFIWKIPLRQKTALYLPTKFQDEIVLPAYQASSIEYWKLQEHLASRVFSKAALKVIIKLRKKGLITTDSRNMHPLQLLKLPPNVELKSSPDFKYIRYAADLLIVDYATSTLGWALATDKPTVYLHHDKTPLEDEVRELMKESLFLIDIEEGNDAWEKELLFVLNRDKETLLKDWRAKEGRRALFLEKYIWGRKTKTTNKDFIDWLRKLKTSGNRATPHIASLNDLAPLRKTGS